jgi:sugar-specific transcriptional regulator TrmB
VQFKSPLPNQTKEIYSLLLKKGALNAEQIGKELHIFPHAVYRSIDQLKSLGCIHQIGQRPAMFEAQPVTESVETFSLLQREWFLKAFLANQNGNNSFEEQVTISFIESREAMFEKAIDDLENVKREINFLASGDEIPAEIMLAQTNALKRGVVIRSLFQKRTKENESFLQARKQMGEMIRIYKPVNVRIFLFDQKVTYVMSYDSSNYIKSMGIRFEYAPLGQLMHALFMQYWEKGKEL